MQRRDPNHVPEVDETIKEQLVIGLRDDSLRRKMKVKCKDNVSLKFNELMQAAITWSEEEEIPADVLPKNNIRAPQRTM